MPIDASTPKLKNLASERFKGSQHKLALAVISQVLCSGRAGLYAIRSYDFSRHLVSNVKMLTDRIEFVFVFASGERGLEPFVQLKVKNLEAETVNR
jgi:hypothetical protein